MNTPPEEKWEMHVLNAARAFPYPPTPDVAGATRVSLRPRQRTRRAYLRVAAVLAFVVLASILFVPEIRAGVLEVLRIGAVRIFFSSAETPTNIPNTPSAQTIETDNATLEDAERLLDIPIELPSYPPDLGMPDSISILGDAVPVVTLVWRDQEPDDVRLVLQMIGYSVDVVKHGLPDSRQVEVNGEYAIWLDVPHVIEINDANGREIPGVSWLVQSNVLVWVQGEITYRLETTQLLDEALAIAESLRPVSRD